MKLSIKELAALVRDRLSGKHYNGERGFSGPCLGENQLHEIYEELKAQGIDGKKKVNE